MSWLTRTFTYSIGKKLVMALTGLFLITFLIEHVIGNFFLFATDGGEAYNEYSHNMTTNPLIRIIEIFLFASIIFHSIQAFRLTAQNRAARPERYIKKAASPQTSWLSRNMILTGSIILLFIIIHLKSFFVPYRFGLDILTDAKGERSIYLEVAKAFQNPLYSGFYILSLVVIGMHMWHGFSSGFQTLGIRHPKYFPVIKSLGVLLTLFITVGFALQPIYFLALPKLMPSYWEQIAPYITK